MSGSAINHDAVKLQNQVKAIIFDWRRKNRGQLPRYLFLSPNAYTLLGTSIGFNTFNKDFDSFMGIEIAFVGVPGVYAAIGEVF